MTVPGSKRSAGDRQAQQQAASKPKQGRSQATTHEISHSTGTKVAPSQLVGASASSQKDGGSIGKVDDTSATKEDKLGGDADAIVMNENPPHTTLPALRSGGEVAEAPQQKQQGKPLPPEKEQRLPSEAVLATTTGRRIHTVHGSIVDLDAAEPLHFVAPSTDAIVRPDDYDVLLDRDFLANSHPGNKRFLDLAEACREDYNNCTASEKSSIPRKIVQAIRIANPPGRFLKSEPADRQWYDVGCNEAVKICSEVIRGMPSNITSATTAVDASPAEEEVPAAIDFGCRMKIVTDDSHCGSEGIVASSKNSPSDANAHVDVNEEGSNEARSTCAGAESDDENRSTTPSLCGSSPTSPLKEGVAGEEEEKEEKSHSNSIDGSVISAHSSAPPVVELVERGTQKNASSEVRGDSAMCIDGKPTRITIAVSKKSASGGAREDDAMSIDRKPLRLKIAVSKKLCSKQKDDDSIISISSNSSSSFSSSSLEIIENENEVSSDTPEATGDKKASEGADRDEGSKKTESVGSGGSDDYDSSDDERSMKMTFLSESDFKSSSDDVPMSIDVEAPSPESIKDAKEGAALSSSGSEPAAEATVVHTRIPLSVAQTRTPLSSADRRDRDNNASSKDAAATGGGVRGRKRPLNRSVSSVYSDGARKKFRRLTSSGDKKAAREGELALAAPMPLIQGKTSNDLSSMEYVEHLTRTELDATTGKPIHYITAYSKCMGKCIASNIVTLDTTIDLSHVF